MTERPAPKLTTLHTDEDGTELQISDSRLGFVSICLESLAGNLAQVFIPEHLADKGPAAWVSVNDVGDSGLQVDGRKPYSIEFNNDVPARIIAAVAEAAAKGTDR